MSAFCVLKVNGLTQIILIIHPVNFDHSIRQVMKGDVSHFHVAVPGGEETEMRQIIQHLGNGFNKLFSVRIYRHQDGKAERGKNQHGRCNPFRGKHQLSGSRRAPLLPNEPLHLSFKPPGEGVFWNFFIGRQPAQPQIFRFGHRLVEVRIRDLHVRLHLLALQ